MHIAEDVYRVYGKWTLSIFNSWVTLIGKPLEIFVVVSVMLRLSCLRGMCKWKLVKGFLKANNFMNVNSLNRRNYMKIMRL